MIKEEDYPYYNFWRNLQFYHLFYRHKIFFVEYENSGKYRFQVISKKNQMLNSKIKETQLCVYTKLTIHGQCCLCSGPQNRNYKRSPRSGLHRNQHMQQTVRTNKCIKTVIMLQIVFTESISRQRKPVSIL